MNKLFFLLIIMVTFGSISTFAESDDQFNDLYDDRDGTHTTSTFIRIDTTFKTREDAVAHIKKLEKEHSFSFRDLFKKYGGRIDDASEYLPNVASKDESKEDVYTFSKNPKKMNARYYRAGFDFFSKESSKKIPKHLNMEEYCLF